MILILKVAAAIGLIVVLLRKKMNLGYVMLIDSVFLGILFALKPLTIVQTIFKGLSSWETIELVLILAVIMVLEAIMREKLYIEKMVNSLKALFRDQRVVAAIIPALIGFIPSAGGAVFSAPMVNELGNDMGMSPEQKSFVNFWYRHLWEFVMPIYPSILIGSQLFNISVGEFVRVTFPFSIIAILIGIFFGFRGINGKKQDKHKEGVSGHIKDLLAGTWPTIAIIFMVLILKTDVLYAVISITLLLLLVNKYNIRELPGMLKKSLSLKIIVMIGGVMVFKNMLEAADVISGLPQVLSSYGIPAVLAVFIICFLPAFLTGLAPAFVAISFPVVAAMSSPGDLRLMAFAYVCGIAGVMLSPMHLCLTLTVDYYKADLVKVLNKIIGPEAVLAASALAIYYLF